FGEYNYASGDDNRHDGRRQTFDQLYATGHDKFGLADQVGWRNIHHLRSGIEIHPSPRVLATARYHSWLLDTTAAGLYHASRTAPLVVPALVERPRGASAEALAFALQLAAGELEAVIFLTGTGTRMLANAIDSVLPRPALADALNRIAVVARGPKPYAALRELGGAAPRQALKARTW